MKEKLITVVEHYIPVNEQEATDKTTLLRWLRSDADISIRDNLVGHLTASAWVVNPDRTKVLMAYHNLYNSWAWLGGHADGDTDLLSAAMREVQEETGLQNIRPVSEEIYSLEILTVNAHFKKGRYVVPHLHLNLTYLLEADEAQDVHSKPDENSAVRWFSLEDAVAACSEPWMQKHIYTKLNEKLRTL